MRREPILGDGEEPKYEKTTFLKYILAKYTRRTRVSIVK